MDQEIRPQNSDGSVTSEKKSGGKGIIWAIIVIIVIAAIGYFVYAASDTTNTDSVASVNGVSIGKDLFDARLEQAKEAFTAQGGDLSTDGVERELEHQVLTQLINEQLVYQAAQADGVEVADGAVDEQYNQIASRFASEQEFETEVMRASFDTTDAFKKDVRRQILTQNYIDAFAADLGITVTDAEVDAVYANLTEAQTTAAEVPALEDIRETLRNEILQSQIANSFQTRLAELRSAAKIDISLEGFSVDTTLDTSTPASATASTPAIDATATDEMKTTDDTATTPDETEAQ